MAKVKFDEDEAVLKEGRLPYLKNRLKLIPGTGYLTNRRFVHTDNMSYMARAGRVGSLVGELRKGKVDFDVPLSSISRISKDVHGRNKVVLKIETIDGSEYKLLTEEFDDWRQALHDALWSLFHMRLEEGPPGVWTAAHL
jgi:hypothetical protein